MSEHHDLSDMEGDSQDEDFRECHFLEDYLCWDDFEYIETFLPRNYDC